MGSTLSWTPGIRETEEKFQIFYTSAVTKNDPSHSSSYNLSFTAHSAEGWMGPKANLYTVYYTGHILSLYSLPTGVESLPGKKAEEIWTRLQVLARISRLIKSIFT